MDWKWNKQLYENNLENSFNLLMKLTELF